MNQLPNRPIVQKENRWRNRAYLNYVKSLPCIFPGCGVYGCDPHHIKHARPRGRGGHFAMIETILAFVFLVLPWMIGCVVIARFLYVIVADWWIDRKYARRKN
jgi:hypothetical protein